MEHHWIDADALIQSKNGPYGFDIAPGFWNLIDEAIESGHLRSANEVHEELSRGQDDLTDWVAERPELFAEADESVQQEFRTIADYVEANYDEAHAQEFLSGADAWLIAHAAQDGGIVVTREKAIAPNAKR